MFSPAQFGKYYLTERIAVGGMAEIFKAMLYGVDGFEKSMVVKQILPQYARNTEFIQMFIDEAKIAVTLTHGNIVPVYELGRLGETYFIAMEYVSGKDLAEILEVARNRNIPISPDHAAYIAIEVCKGLDYAHRRTDPQGRPLGVVHRDISPPNILISHEGEVKVTDFGIAKAAHKLGTTEAGVVKGTFGYMSPEQVRGLPVDHRTDIFSTGILLHEMLTGKRLFTGRSDLEAIERVKDAQIPAPSAVGAWVPSSIDPIVFRALARDPADRYPSANELQLALSRFLFTAGQGATASTFAHYMLELFGDEAARKKAAPQEEILYSALSSEVRRPSTRPRPGAPPRPMHAAAGVDNMTQSYAVRPELEEATAISPHPAPALMDAHPSRAQATLGAAAGLAASQMDVGDGTAKPINATMAMPSLIGADRLPEREFDEEAPTAIFSTAAGPQKPKVPELRFPTKAKRGRSILDEPEGSQPRTLPQIPSAMDRMEEELPSPDELATLAESFDEALPRGASLPAPGGKPALALREVATSPDVEIRPLAPPDDSYGGRPLAPPDGDDLMAALADAGGRDGAGEGPGLPSPADDEPRPGQIHTVSRKRRRPVSGVLSGTMRLFVQGLDDEEHYPLQESLPGQESFPGELEEEGLPTGLSGGSASLSGGSTSLSGGSASYSGGSASYSGGSASLTGASEAMEIPRTIKPTVLGWLIIGLVMLGAGFFVVYKKTNLFGNQPGLDSGETDTLKPEDFKKEAAKKKVSFGTIIIASNPPGASFLLFEGETPMTIERLDPGRSHALRIERDGYRGVYHLVKPEDFSGGKATVAVTLDPGGAGSEEIPRVEAGGGEAHKATLTVKSTPPKAMTWRIVGQGDKIELASMDKSKSHYFKLVLAGHRAAYVTISEVDFKEGGDTYSTTVKLDPEASAAAGDGGAAAKATDSGAGATAAAAATPDARPTAARDGAARTEPRTEPLVEPKPEVKPEVKPRPRRPRRPRKPRKPKAQPKPPPKPQPKPQPGKKIFTPAWAQ